MSYLLDVNNKRTKNSYDFLGLFQYGLLHLAHLNGTSLSLESHS
jgi:hypothetical protein